MEASTGASTPTQGATSPEPRRKIAIQVLTPSPEVPGGRFTLDDVPVDTSLAELRTRISQRINSSSWPGRQRLIYRGRPLGDDSLTVFEIFSAELTSATPPDVFTIHLVMPLPTHQPNSNQALTSSTALQHPPGPPHASNQPPNPAIPAQLLQQMQAQMMQQMQQFHQIQQQMRNTQHLSAPFQHPPPPQFVPQALGAAAAPTLPGSPSFPPVPNSMPQMPSGFGLRQGFPQAVPGQLPPNLGSTAGANHWPSNAAQIPPVHSPHLSQGPNSAPWPPASAYNHPVAGLSIGASPAQSTEPSRASPLPTNNPQANIGSQSRSDTAESLMPNIPSINQQFPQPSGSMSVHEGIGPNGQRFRTVVGQTFNVVQAPRPGSAPPSQGNHNSHGSLVQNTAPTQLPPMPTRPSVSSFGPQFNTAHNPLHPGMPFMPPPLGQVRPPADLANSILQVNSNGFNAPTTAWLLSSPTGPQGFLFSPNHGLFSTTIASNANSRAAAMRPFMSGSRLRRHADVRNGDRNRQAEAGPAIQAALAQPRERQPAENANRDILRGVIRRAWIFVRFYLLALFFSEYGTWRRWILLIIAVIACLLPETTLFRDIGQRVQRHIENLVPLAPRGGQGERQGQQGAADSGRDAGSPQGQGARRQEPTPEQTAERLRREHQQRQVAWWREGLSRAERAVALFIATLFPGVGERHIQARNDAEAERRAAEQGRLEAEQSTARNDGSDEAVEVSSNGSGMAQSSAVEGQEGGGRPRQRNNDEARPVTVEV